MDTLDNSSDRQPRSVKDRLDRLEEIIGQLAPERQNVMMGLLSAGTLADDLRKAISDSGMTHYALAKKCGISQILLKRFTTGERDMRIATASKICEVLGYGLARLEATRPIKKATDKQSTKKATRKKKPPG